MASLLSTSSAPVVTLPHSAAPRAKCTIRQIGFSADAQPETLQIVQSTIAKQLSIDGSTVNPQTKFADLGADSLDTFSVSIGDGGAENIATVQDAADLIEKVKAAAA